jgi:hypothetical protein
MYLIVHTQLEMERTDREKQRWDLEVKLKDIEVLFHPKHYICKVSKKEKLEMMGVEEAVGENTGDGLLERDITRAVTITTASEEGMLISVSSVVPRLSSRGREDDPGVYASSFTFFFTHYLCEHCLIARILLSEYDALYSFSFLSLMESISLRIVIGFAFLGISHHNMHFPHSFYDHGR